MKKKKVVIALGHIALGATLPEQLIAARHTAKVISDLIEHGYQIVISHSNAPQIGMIHTAMNEFQKQYPEYTEAPMSVCSAMSQGYIGYDLQNSIRKELLRRGIAKAVSTILTQVIVDPYDEAFYEPVKVIGRTMTAAEAKAEEAKGNYMIEEPGKGFRRIVAAPKPKEIVEIDAIKLLSDADQIVIAGGGGGIPVLDQDRHLKGASAVIEKDFTAGLLAEELNADILLFLTDIDYASLNYGKENQTSIHRISIEELNPHLTSKEFGCDSMLPKIQASISFLEKSENRTAIITSLDKALDALAERTGTIIKN